MADPLISVEELEARLARTFSDDEVAQVNALSADASALIRHVAGTDFAAGVPEVVVAIVAQMVRRAFDNPGELTGEQIGAYAWQSQTGSGSRGGSIYITRAERRLIRGAAGRSQFTPVALTTGDPDDLVTDDEL